MKYITWVMAAFVSINICFGQDEVDFYNQGIVSYEEKHFIDAVDQFRQGLLQEPEGELKRDVHYNLGNALYRLGEEFKEKEVSKTIEHWQKAVIQYERALGVDGDDAQAQENLDFVKKQIDQLKQQQQQQEQQQSQEQNQEQNQEQQNQDHQQKQNQQEQNQQSNNQQEQDQQQDQSQQQEQNQQQDQQENNQDQNSQENAQQQDQQNKDNNEAPSIPQEDHQPSEFFQQSSDDVGEGELTETEARMLLENYEHNEQPRGLLHFIPRKSQGRGDVLHDW